MKVHPISAPRVLVALCGDMRKDPESIVKYGEFLAALDRRIPSIDVYNAKLHSLQRLINAVPVWHPNLKKWSERANKDPLRLNFVPERWNNGSVTFVIDGI